MNNPNSVPAIVTNTFGVGLASGGLRIVFGERTNNEDNFHSAVQIDGEGARLLIDLLQKTLGYGQTGSLPEGGEGTGSQGLIMGSTSVH